MPNFEQMIAQRVQAFVSDITELARQQALETLSAALAAGAGRGRAGVRGRNGAGPARAVRRGRDRSGNRRSPEEIDRASQALLSEIQANPGLRVEQIGRTLGAATKDLTLPLKKLLSQRMVRSEGQRRATRYFPAGGGRASGRAKGRAGGRGRGKKKAAAATAAAAE